MAISVSFQFSWAAQPEARGPALCWVLAFSTASCHQLVWSPKLNRGSRGPLLQGAVFLYRILSPTDWISCALSYIIVHAHSISRHHWSSEYALLPSLEWHVWSSSSGNNCHAVHRSLSSSASVCDCTMGFYPCPILSAKLAHANGICTSAVFGMACLARSEVNIQQVVIRRKRV